ncbi:MAG: transposase [Bacteroidota bacterium]
MSFVKIWVHAVWGTKNRERILLTEPRKLICHHIQQNASVKGFHVNEVNGYLEHVHCLMLLKADWNIGKQMQMIKGEAANWVNKNGILQQKLEWADEYFAASVSEGKLDILRNYIRNQEEHHRKISFEEEYSHFLKTFGNNVG